MPQASDKRRIGPFQIESKLGTGGMGVVYLATYIKTGQKVAVKVLSPDLTSDLKVAKRFEREMDILKKLKHPNIIQYFGGNVTGSQRYYAMEVISGGSLDRKLKKEGRFSWQDTVDYALQIARALEYAHNAGIIHRDLKPGNLLLTDKGVLKLSDFGIARDNDATQLTATGKTLGTMSYMAPEQITGRQPISQKTDLYALGCVIFEMLTGRPPFNSETQPELLFKHVEEEPPSVRELNWEVPKWLEDLIFELLEKDPNERPFDALAVQVKLEDVRKKVAEQESLVQKTVVGGGSGLTMKDRDPQLQKLLGRKKKRKKKKKTAFYEQTWFLSLILLAMVAGAVFALRPPSEEQLFAGVQPIMASGDPDDWFAAEPELTKLLSRFPDGTHAAQSQQWLDQITAERTARNIETRLNFGHLPDTEGERLYVQAREFERFGDRFSALEAYESMKQVFADSTRPEDRPFLILATREADRIRQSAGGNSDRLVFIRQQIAAGDDLYTNGRRTDAREKWRSVVTLYGNRREFEVQVRQAEARLDDPEAAFAAEAAAAEDNAADPESVPNGEVLTGEEITDAIPVDEPTGYTY